MEEISKSVSHILDNIGYSSGMIQTRRNVYQETSTVRNTRYNDIGFHEVIVGSKSEGMTSFYESDIDHMILLIRHVVTEDVRLVQHLTERTIFLADMSSTSPGYTKLKVSRLHDASLRPEVKDSLYKTASNEICVSSDFFKMAFRQTVMRDRVGTFEVHLHGPAHTISIGDVRKDIAFGFPGIVPSIVHKWANRPRKFNWPTPEMRDKIQGMPCQLVPTGYKGSRDMFAEWRFCFVEAELELFKTLNETQLKLTTLLKMLKKFILKPVNSEMTSYAMKNIVFWMAECLPWGVFIPSNLILLTTLALRFLKYRIETNNLPYYMIPERNLIACRISRHAKLLLIEKLTEMIGNVPKHLMCCPRLCQGAILLYKMPEQLVRYGRKRDLLERLKLLSFRLLNVVDTGETEVHIEDMEDLNRDLEQMRHDISFPEIQILLFPLSATK